MGQRYVEFYFYQFQSAYLDFQDWIHDGSVDLKGKGRADGLVNAKAIAAAEAAKADAELRAMYVVVPPGDEAQSMSCPICKEPLKAEFLEDDEEWVWRNAVRKDDKVCVVALLLPAILA